MKLALAILLTLVSSHAAFAGSGALQVEWTCLVTTNCVFKLYESPSIAAPMTNWNVIAIVGGTNRSCIVTVVPGVHFFSMTASNFWGESPFSNVVSTPEVLDGLGPTSLRVSKWP